MCHLNIHICNFLCVHVICLITYIEMYVILLSFIPHIQCIIITSTLTVFPQLPSDPWMHLFSYFFLFLKITHWVKVTLLYAHGHGCGIIYWSVACLTIATPKKSDFPSPNIHQLLISAWLWGGGGGNSSILHYGTFRWLYLMKVTTQLLWVHLNHSHPMPRAEFCGTVSHPLALTFFLLLCSTIFPKTWKEVLIQRLHL